MSVPLKRKHNTRVYKEGLVTEVWLYNTPIFKFDAATRIATLFTGGWETMTTRRRITEAINEICFNSFYHHASVYSRKGISVLRLDGVEHPFIGGLLTIQL
jgi:hypothetical protein